MRRRLAQELVERARVEKVGLVGPGGLLTGLTKTVLETARWWRKRKSSQTRDPEAGSTHCIRASGSELPSRAAYPATLYAVQETASLTSCSIVYEAITDGRMYPFMDSPLWFDRASIAESAIAL